MPWKTYLMTERGDRREVQFERRIDLRDVAQVDRDLYHVDHSGEIPLMTVAPPACGITMRYGQSFDLDGEEAARFLADFDEFTAPVFSG